MVKFSILFGVPAETLGFENLYNDFLALVERMPGITRREVSNVIGSPRGDSPFYRMLEVYFESYDQLDAALNSPAGQEAGGELSKFPAGTFEMLFAEVYEETGGQTPASHAST
jgi:uncharacterized protein (TIGR02118 family)